MFYTVSWTHLSAYYEEVDAEIDENESDFIRTTQSAALDENASSTGSVINIVKQVSNDCLNVELSDSLDINKEVTRVESVCVRATQLAKLHENASPKSSVINTVIEASEVEQFSIGIPRSQRTPNCFTYFSQCIFIEKHGKSTLFGASLERLFKYGAKRFTWHQ